MKIFLTYEEDFKQLSLFIENNLKKISGHRTVFHPDKSDFILHLSYGSDDAISPVMNKDDDILQGI
jgi:hypothetical protein